MSSLMGSQPGQAALKAGYRLHLVPGDTHLVVRLALWHRGSLSLSLSCVLQSSGRAPVCCARCCWAGWVHKTRHSPSTGRS